MSTFHGHTRLEFDFADGSDLEHSRDGLRKAGLME
jgi:hypothetical protein